MKRLFVLHTVHMMINQFHTGIDIANYCPNQFWILRIFQYFSQKLKAESLLKIRIYFNLEKTINSALCTSISSTDLSISNIFA
jgi:hypothetical protein